MDNFNSNDFDFYGEEGVGDLSMDRMFPDEWFPDNESVKLLVKFLEGSPKLWCSGKDGVTFVKSAEGGDSRPIPLHFLVETCKELKDWIIRARISFDGVNTSEVPKRCPSHLNTGPSGFHLLTISEGSSVNHSYCDEPFSVIIPISKTDFLVNFQFKCYSSCAKGINRKPIKLVFDLETQGRIAASCEMKIKIVGNPERDVKKGEAPQPPNGKIRKRKAESSSSDDEEVYTIPSFKVQGKKNYNAIKQIIKKLAIPEAGRSAD